MTSYYLPPTSKIGVGYQVHALAEEMVGRGHDVTVFSPCEPPDGRHYAWRDVEVRGSNRTFKFALALRRMDWSGFDVLHAHGDDYWMWRQRPVAHIRTLHGSCFDEALRIRGSKERLRMLLLGISEVVASLVADATVAVSSNTRRWTPWVHTVIPNGVDISLFRPGDKSAEPSILFVGTYLRRKRGSMLAEIFERDIRPQLPDCRLWMVCDDAPPMDGVDVLGRVSTDELAQLYRRAWLFCLPSTYEGFGIPYIEAMASGCPVVATRNPGAVEVTEGGRVGLLADAARLGTALLDLLGSEDERARLTEAGLEAARRYDLVTVADQYENLYRSLASAQEDKQKLARLRRRRIRIESA